MPGLWFLPLRHGGTTPLGALQQAEWLIAIAVLEHPGLHGGGLL